MEPAGGKAKAAGHRERSGVADVGRHCRVSPAARASCAAMDAARVPRPRRRHRRCHQNAHVGQDAFPLGVGAAGHGTWAVLVGCMMVNRCSRPCSPTSLTSSGGHSPSRLMASGLPWETVSSSEGCCSGRSSAKNKAADPSPWPPCDRVRVSSVTCWASSYRDARGGVQGPLRPHQGRDAEEAQEVHCPGDSSTRVMRCGAGRRVLPRNGSPARAARGESSVVEPQTASPRQLDDGSGTGVESHGSSLPAQTPPS